MTDVPGATAVTTPAGYMVATAVLLLDHVPPPLKDGVRVVVVPGHIVNCPQIEGVAQVRLGSPKWQELGERFTAFDT